MLEFLFENPFLLIIIIGIISSMFRKSKGSDPNKQKQQTQRRTVQIPPIEEPYQQSSKLEKVDMQPNENKSHIEREYTARKKQAKEKRQDLIEQPRMAEIKSAQPRTGSDKPLQVTPSQSKQEKGPTPSMDKQKLVDGIIWSEVLGAPRAFNPHQTIKRQQGR